MWECTVFTATSAKQNYLDEGKFVDMATEMSRLALGDHTEMPDNIHLEKSPALSDPLNAHVLLPCGQKLELTGLQSL